MAHTKKYVEGGGGFGRVCLSRDDGFGLLTGDKTSNSIQGA